MERRYAPLLTALTFSACFSEPTPDAATTSGGGGSTSVADSSTGAPLPGTSDSSGVDPDGTTTTTDGTSEDTGPTCTPGTPDCVCDEGDCEAGLLCVDDTCLLACGNGEVDGAEECDDDNLEPGDGCSASCTLENQCLVGSVDLTTSVAMLSVRVEPDGDLRLVDERNFTGAQWLAGAADALNTRGVASIRRFAYQVSSNPDAIYSVELQMDGRFGVEPPETDRTGVRAIRGIRAADTLLAIADGGGTVEITAHSVADDGALAQAGSYTHDYDMPSSSVVRVATSSESNLIQIIISSGTEPLEQLSLSLEAGELTLVATTGLPLFNSVRSIRFDGPSNDLLLSGLRTIAGGNERCLGAAPDVGGQPDFSGLSLLCQRNDFLGSGAIIGAAPGVYILGPNSTAATSLRTIDYSNEDYDLLLSGQPGQIGAPAFHRPFQTTLLAMGAAGVQTHTVDATGALTEASFLSLPDKYAAGSTSFQSATLIPCPDAR
ncbi:MAG: hypothetical protein AAF721_06890 [Myxococcota bacterium]